MHSSDPTPQTDPQFKLRLPEDCKVFIETQADRNASSQTSEIVRCIRDRMEAASTGAEIIYPLSSTDGHAIRKAREGRGWTQAKLAAMAGTNQQTIDRIERAAVRGSRVIPAVKATLGINVAANLTPTSDDCPFPLHLPSEKVAQPTISAEPAIIPGQNNARLTALRDEIETAFDLLTALDKAGDGIGGDVGHGISAVALAARSALDNARDMLRAMEGSSNG